MKHLFSLLLFLCSAALGAQTCAPSTPITLARAPFGARQITDIIDQNRAIFEPSDIAEAERLIQRCRLEMDVALTDIDNKTKQLTQLYQEVLTVRDVKGMQQQITELEASKQEALQALQSQLKNQGQSGLFVVYLRGIDPFGNANEWRQAAQRALELRAIEDLNGTVIERLTRVTDQQQVRDVINALTKGKVEAESVLLDEVNTAKGDYLYMAKVRVTPLAPDENAGLEAASGNEQALVINPLLETEFSRTLLRQGVDAAEITAIEDQVLLWQRTIADANTNADDSRQRFISASERNIRNLDAQITDLRSQYANRSQKIQQYCNQLSLSFDRNNLTRSADDILRHIKTQLAELEKNWRTTKSREIFVKDAFVSTDGDVKAALAKKAEELTENLRQSHSTTTKRIEAIEIEDLSLTGYSSTREVELLRELRQIWMMPVGRSGGFELYVFASFEVTGDQVSGGTYGGTAPDNFIRIPGGTFQMGDQYNEGDDDEKPVHTVEVSTFYLSPTEVTFAEYDAFCTATGRDKPSDSGWGRDQRPAINVSWCDAVEYANWLSTKNGLQTIYSGNCDNIRANWEANGYRLPTEAEWEYAARQGGQKVRFGNGKDIADPAEINFDGDPDEKESYSRSGVYREKSVQVGSLNSPNSLGLHDMSGNVWEWCWDWFASDYYKNSPRNNPQGPTSGSNRVLRGGSWNFSPAYVRCTSRGDNSPGFRLSLIGFRLARAGR
ncbi:formylglycine-generating enzyme family protein [Lewinella sp. LCG006]|uniref:formylglycine-generating enzyme family protein n=1 Tax=Lewinella sp. LCG006 TaxID=3231911 RepID=UPI00345F9366